MVKRSEITVGLIVGAILTLAIAGSLDIFLPLGEEGWSEAISKSIYTILGHPWEQVLAVRILFYFISILIVTTIGALIGAVFAVMLSSFFRRMFHAIENHDDE